MVAIILAFITTYCLVYPLSRFIFFAGLKSNNEYVYLTSSILGAIWACSLNLALWFFATKMFVLAV